MKLHLNFVESDLEYKTLITTTGKIQFTVPLEFNGKISTSATDNAENLPILMLM
ncbi:MAG: hypothetical protein N2B06_00245 [Clostridium sp.]